MWHSELKPAHYKHQLMWGATRNQSLCPLRCKGYMRSTISEQFRYITALWYKRFHCRRIPAAIQCEWKGLWFLICVFCIMYAGSRHATTFLAPWQLQLRLSKQTLVHTLHQSIDVACVCVVGASGSIQGYGLDQVFWEAFHFCGEDHANGNRPIAIRKLSWWTVIESDVTHINRRHPVLVETGSSSGYVITGIIGWLGVR